MTTPASGSDPVATAIDSAVTTIQVGDQYVAGGQYGEAVGAYKTAGSQMATLPGFPATEGGELAAMSVAGATAADASRAAVYADQILSAVKAASAPAPEGFSALEVLADVALGVGLLGAAAWGFVTLRRRRRR